ncbi:MAG: biotin transporter BioY [Vulcanimicrobiota bacterium]
MKVLAGSLAVALAAQLIVPLGAVPLTLQSLAVLLAGAWLGPGRGAACLALYLVAAALGAPVLAGGEGGLAQMGGPSAGYLWGFLPAAAAAGWMHENGCPPLLTMAGGTAVILLCGVPWLAYLLDPSTAVWQGLVLVLPGATIKVLLGAAILMAGKKFGPD